MTSSRGRFFPVLGKGGTGRTTVAALIGAAAARRHRVLLGCCDPQSALLQPGPLRALLDDAGVTTIYLDPWEAQTRYVADVLHNRWLAQRIFANRHVRGFLDALPGLHRWAQLGALTWELLAPRSPWDVVVLDAPATGHGLDTLLVPFAIAETVPQGRLRSEAEQRIAMLTDSGVTCAVVVTLLSELAVTEANQIWSALHRYGVAPGVLVRNKALSPLPTACPRCGRPWSTDAAWAEAIAAYSRHWDAQQRAASVLADAPFTVSLPPLDNTPASLATGVDLVARHMAVSLYSDGARC